MRHVIVSAALLSLLGACTSRSDDTPRAGDSARADSNVASTARVKTVEGFSTPEGVRYDAASDAWFVSNINGQPLAKDGNGFISRLTSDGTIDSLHFIMGGRGGVTLNAPKGMAIIGDTIYVADIDAVRAFNKTTGAAIRSWELGGQGAVFLNDVVATPDGDVYVTDTQVKFGADGSMSHPGADRVFMLARDRKSASVPLTSDSLGRPNGIAWDAANGRLIVVSFGADKIQGWTPGTGAARGSAPAVIARGLGQFDGVEVLSDGRILVSSWTDSSISVVQGDSVVKLISGVEAPADFGVDPKRMLVAIPLFNGNTVDIWRIGGAEARP